MSTRVLTGITTTGTPHLGNYVGAIRPAVAMSREAGVDAFYFMADYHALIKCDDPARVHRSRLEIAATWLACGLDPGTATMYRQSGIPEIPQLTWLLTCVTAKGLLNRAHAYKAAVDKNQATGEDADAGITAGLYMYPVLMAADILAFNTHKVPVGRDQVQHIEMARDIAQRFNHIYGGEYFVLPEVSIEENVATLPGLDGRKMSKSYDNTIPLFEGGAKRQREAIMRIVTDSRAPGEPKDAEGSALFAIYRAFARADESETFRVALEQGMAWGEAKQVLFARIDGELAPLRARYDTLMAHPDDIEDILHAGAAKARAVATPLLDTLRRAVGLGTGKQAKSAGKAKSSAGKNGKHARVVSFRDTDGSFRFRLLAGNGDELALSRAYADPKAAGHDARRLLAADTPVQVRSDGDTLALMLDDETLAVTSAFADAAERDGAAARLHEELAAARQSI
ncbi:MAG TPA: tryptophan--tRNA ligase [Rhodanobacteraceae bacterium]